MADNRESDPSSRLQDFLVFGEYGGVNPSIEDSSTFTFLSPEKMRESFYHEIEGCFLYSRHWNPTNKYLADALSLMEGSESCQVTSSGMAAISCTILQLCRSGDEIISADTVYGGTYALLKNFLSKFGIITKFVNIADHEKIKSQITDKTKLIFCESFSNPLLVVADIPLLSAIAKKHNIKLVVDNTFSPLIISPIKLGADIVIHSMTKFINGMSDCLGGCICSSKQFVVDLSCVHNGASMLLGPSLDSIRVAGILKNLHTLHVRVRQHSKNALYLAEKLFELGIAVYYPGLKSHPQHALMKQIMNDGYGFGGMLSFNAGTDQIADNLMTLMQKEKIGLLAVSLGYFKTLFSSPSHSTSSEIPLEEQERIGLKGGIVRMSIGLDNDIERSFTRMKKCLNQAGVI